MTYNTNAKHGHRFSESIQFDDFNRQSGRKKDITKKIGLDPSKVNLLVNKLNREIQDLQNEDGSLNPPSFLNETDTRSSGFASETERLEFYLASDFNSSNFNNKPREPSQKKYSDMSSRNRRSDLAFDKFDESDINSNFTRLFSSDMKYNFSKDSHKNNHSDKTPDSSNKMLKEDPRIFEEIPIVGKNGFYLRENAKKKQKDSNVLLPASKDNRTYSSDYKHLSQGFDHSEQFQNEYQDKARVSSSPVLSMEMLNSFHPSSEFGSEFSLDPYNKSPSINKYGYDIYKTSTPNEFIENNVAISPKLTPSMGLNDVHLFDSNNFDKNHQNKNHVGFDLSNNQMFTRSPTMSYSTPWQVDSFSFNIQNSSKYKAKAQEESRPISVNEDAYDAICSKESSRSSSVNEKIPNWDITENNRLPRERIDVPYPIDRKNSPLSDDFDSENQSLTKDNQFVSHRSLAALPFSQNGAKLKGSLKALRTKISQLEIDKITSEQRIKYLEALLRRVHRSSENISRSHISTSITEPILNNIPPKNLYNNSHTTSSKLPNKSTNNSCNKNISSDIKDEIAATFETHSQDHERNLRQLLSENNRIKKELAILTRQLNSIIPLISPQNQVDENYHNNDVKSTEFNRKVSEGNINPERSYSNSYKTKKKCSDFSKGNQNAWFDESSRLLNKDESSRTYPDNGDNDFLNQQTRHVLSNPTRKEAGSSSHNLNPIRQTHKTDKKPHSPSIILGPAQSFNTYDNSLKSKNVDSINSNLSSSHNASPWAIISSPHIEASPNDSFSENKSPKQKILELRDKFQSPTFTLTGSDKEDQDEVETLWESASPRQTSKKLSEFDPLIVPVELSKKDPNTSYEEKPADIKKRLVHSSTLKEAIELIRSRTDQARAAKILANSRQNKDIKDFQIPPATSPSAEITLQLIDSVVVTLQNEYQVCRSKYDGILEKLTFSQPSMNSSPSSLLRNSPHSKLMTDLKSVLKEMEVKMDQIHLLQQVQTQFFRQVEIK